MRDLPLAKTKFTFLIGDNGIPVVICTKDKDKKNQVQRKFLENYERKNIIVRRPPGARLGIGIEKKN